MKEHRAAKGRGNHGEMVYLMKGDCTEGRNGLFNEG